MPKKSGVKVLIKVNTGTEESPNYVTLGGQRDATLNRGSDLIDVSSKDGDGYKSSVVGLKDWSVEVEAMYVSSNAGIIALEDAYRNGTLVQIQVIEDDGSKEEGSGYVSAAPKKAPMNGAYTCSFTINGNGPLVSNKANVTTPTITNPTAAETGVPVTDTFTSSAFAVSTGSDTHESTQYQITTSDDDNFLAPVVDTVSTVDKVSIVMATGAIDASTEYQIRVRYKGTALGWSAWSPAITFTTAS